MKGTVRLRELHEAFADRVAFLHVYIREAHPREGWTFGGPVMKRLIHRYAPAAAVGMPSPEDLAGRREAALAEARAAGHEIPTVVDGLDDAVDEAYAAWPTRLYLVDREGRVAYAGGLGPMGFEPDALGEAIEALLAGG